jgi:hypothetical protein
MQYPGRRRLPFRPFRWILWVLPLLIAAALCMGMLRSLQLIPTPADVGQEHSYFSPLPAAATTFLFRLNAPLFGWRSGSLGDPTGFSSAWSGEVPEGECVTFSSMDLQIVPGSSWGSFVHWQVREIGICG